MRPFPFMVMSIVSIDAKDLPAIIGADICILLISSTIESNLSHFAIMASSPLVSLAKSGITSNSCLWHLLQKVPAGLFQIYLVYINLSIILQSVVLLSWFIIFHRATGNKH